ncbi:cystine/glutamate transporter-like isoform X3 [Tachyglossus aculeatus]|uniref:cystine/glutamate transporter-like isoform X3 n=1 Tax=Tachyglossus aculeatus TaxID=9261 RepID=UPI0018F6AC32|nr:cystine/glutamate transporter-like isoform X3 [Tachyglossus aculeatus]
MEGPVFLRRKITLPRACALLIAAMVGSGIFVAPKGVLRHSGSVGLSLVVWLACGLLSLLGALCYAELGTRITKSGGHYTYLLETLGPLPSFLFLWAEYFAIRPANSAVVCLTFGRYILEPFFAPCPTPVPAVKIAALLGFWHTENFQEAFGHSAQALDKLPLALYAGMFAYSGWCQTSFVREELVRPERTVPLSVTASVLTVIVGYMLTNLSYYTVLTAEEVLASEAVAVSFAQRACPGLSSLVPILVALACFGSMNGGILGFSRTLFVASREGQWPPLFAMIHIRRRTPLPAVLLMFPLVTAMVCVGDVYPLLTFFSFSRWLFIGLATLGLMLHRRRHPQLPRPFKVPLVVPAIFSILCFLTVGLSLYADPVNISIGCATVLSGFPIYYLVVRRPAPARCPLPTRCPSVLYYLTVKLQQLLEVVGQEIRTY